MMKKGLKQGFRRVMSVILAGSIALTAAGCGQSSSASNQSENEVPVVTIWGAGGQEVREALQSVANMYNADPNYNKIAKVEVQFVVSGTSEQSLADRLAAAYKAGETDTDFDLIALDDSGISPIIAQTSEDFFIPIDTDKIPNYQNLVFKDNVVGKSFVPYRGTAVMLAYNSDAVPNPPKTDQELYQWIKDHPGRFTYCDPSTGGSGTTFVMNAIYNQLPEEAATSSDKKWENDYKKEWDNAYNLLEELHPFLYQTSGKVQYPNKNAGSLDLLTNGQVDMTPAFINMVLEQKEMGVLPESIKLAQITPPFMGALAGFSIPTIAKDKEAALSVIDFFLSYEAQAESWNTMYASPVVDPEKLENLENKEWMNELDLSSLRFFSIGDMSTDIRTRWTEEIGVLAK